MLAESFGFLDAGRQAFTAHWKEGNTMPGYAGPIDKQTLNVRVRRTRVEQ